MEKVTLKEVENHRWEIVEFLEYLRYIAELYPDYSFSAETLWQLYERGIRIGTFWTEVTDDLSLPDPEWA